MQKISNIISQKKFEIKKTVRSNPTYEIASEFGEYIGLNTLLVMKLFRIYSKEKVLSLRSYLKDSNCDPSKLPGLLIWRLKELTKD